MVTFGIIGAGVLVALLVLLYSIEQRSPAPTAAQQSGTTSQASSGANVAALQDRLKQNPEDVDAMIALGNQYYDAGFYTDAITWYGKVIEKQPNNTDVRTDLGTAYFYSGQNDKAKEQWGIVFQQDPNKLQAHMNLGVLYSSQTPPDNDAAAKEWRTVIQLAPGSPSAQQAQSLLQKIGK